MASEPFSNLTSAEVERLALLSEECAEVIQVIGKILRHGYESMPPNGGPVNRELLEQELGDVEYAMGLLCECGDLNSETIEAHADDKADRVQEFLHEVHERKDSDGK